MKKKNLKQLRSEHKTALLEYQTLRLKRATKVLSQYDATAPNRQRRRPPREFTNEDGIYTASHRLDGTSVGRDLERNYSPAKSLIHQLKMNVIGSEAKLQISMDGAEVQEAVKWFNEVWYPDCDFRDTIDFGTQCQNILASGVREGDCLAVIDDNITEEDTGKMMTWEADQIVSVDKKLLPSILGDPAKLNSDNGIIRDEWGRVLAYCVSKSRGVAVITDPQEVLFWKRDDQARLYKNPWRLNQGRGVPSLLTPATNFMDLYEILGTELQTTKRALKQYAYVKRKTAVTNWENPDGVSNGLPENMGQSAEEVAEQGASQTAQSSKKNYEAIEAMTGGYTDYLNPDDDVIIPDMKHPTPQLQSFIDTVQSFGGSALGMARAYTLLKADSSYISFRGDMCLSWVTFRWLQSQMKRSVMDWTAIKVLRWAMRKKQIKMLPVGWERKILFSFPVMPEVQEVDAQTAIALKMKNGTTDFAQLLGADWEEQITNFSKQLEKVRKLNLPLKIFETVSGGNAIPDKAGTEKTVPPKPGADKKPDPVKPDPAIEESQA